MNKVVIIGAGMSKIGKHMDRNLKSLTAEAVNWALVDAGIGKEQLQTAWVGNVGQGQFEGQSCIKGQIVLSSMGIEGIPVVNVENACASSSTALYAARAMVALGEIDVALVLGMEKMYFEDKTKAFQVLMGGFDIELVSKIMARMRHKEEQAMKAREDKGNQVAKPQGQRSVFMDVYADDARQHMKEHGSTQRQLAVIASKNHFHSSMNPLAQYQNLISVDEVLNGPLIAWPLTRPMCAPIGDGAAAVIVCSEAFARRIGARHAVEVAACVLSSGKKEDLHPSITIRRVAKDAYERAGVGPEDVDVAEVHDATSFGELQSYEDMGFCPPGEGGLFAEANYTTLGGKLPVNVSGGLVSQGHPLGATGARQVVELYWHLTGKAGKRQVEGARVGLAENGGGVIGRSPGAMSVTILKV